MKIIRSVSEITTKAFVKLHYSKVGQGIEKVFGATALYALANPAMAADDGGQDVLGNALSGSIAQTFGSSGKFWLSA